MREKVLIVDDIELNREILAVALGDEYEVLQASDGVQTIEILKTDSEGITALLCCWISSCRMSMDTRCLIT